MKDFREKIYHLIEPRAENENALSRAYDVIMIITIVCSLIPLLFIKSNPILEIINKITASIFIVDYILRLITADFKFQNSSIISFIRYPFSPMAIVDLLSILPSITPLYSVLKTLRVLRLFRALKVIRILRYSRSMRVLRRVFHRQRDVLLAVFALACGYVLVIAIIILQIEPDTFKNYFNALYWSIISLTTIGYGDIYAVSPLGKLITMVSSFVGIAVIALPSGIITAGYIKESHEDESE